MLAVCSGPDSIAFQRNTLRWNMIMDVLTDALSSSALAPNIDWHFANPNTSHPHPSQSAVESTDQSPEKACFSRRLLYYGHHYGFRHNSCSCGQLFQPSAGPNMAVYVEFNRADCL